MSIDGTTAKMAPMTDSARSRAKRGELIEDRRLHLQVPKRRLAELADISPGTMYAAIAGTASEGTYDDLEDVLDTLEANPDEIERNPVAIQSTDEGLIEFELTGVYGVERVVVRGPVANAEELEHAAARIIRDLRERREED